MLNLLHRSVKPLGLAALLCAGQLVWAADPVTDAMQAANAPYRLALYKTGGKSQPEALLALTQAQQAWTQFGSQFAGHPGAPYDRDPAFASSVSEIAKIYTRAMAEVDTSRLGEAHQLLEQVRDIMAEMRQRNQVVVFSDHMNAYHSQMERVLNDGPGILARSKGLLQMTADVGALSYLAQRLATQAPASLSQNTEFTSLLNAVKQSVQALEAALQSQDLAATESAISKLKGPYSKLFAKFG